MRAHGEYPTRRDAASRWGWTAFGALLLACGNAGAASPAQRAYLELAISPDGRWVASVEGDLSAQGGSPVVRELLIRSADGSRELAVPLPCGAVPECWPSSPAWAPDAQQLSFALRTPGSHARSVYRVAPNAGAQPNKLLDFDGTIKSMRYAADGALAMLATAGATKEVGATEAGAPVTGDIDALPPLQRLAVLDPGQTQLRWISRPGLYVYEYDWMPAAKGFVATAAPGDGDRLWWVARLYAFDNARNPAAERLLYAPANAREQLAHPRVSPDGQRTALIVGLMSDFGATGGDVFVVPTGGGAARNLTPGIKASVSAIDWRGSDGHLLATALAGDLTQRLDLGEGRAPATPTTLWSSAESLRELAACSGCPAGTEISLHESYTRAPEIQLGQAGNWRDLTRRNATLVNQTFSAQSLSWQSDGLTIQGWLLLPKQAASGAQGAGAGKLPLIVAVHGGPASAHRPRFIGSGAWHALLNKGYAMLLPNPRGSFGQGEAFTQMNAQDFGGGDLRDILAGVDAAIASQAIDPDRLGITGHSYGGFMTMWAVTQTQRFKAAVAGAGIANWQSYYGQNGINEWMPPYFGATVYADPAVYAKSSPINFIRQVKTPTLSYVGAADLECPPAQTQEFGRARQILGVPASTLIYPGEGHGFRQPSTLADVERRTLAWFDRYFAPH